MPKPTAKPATPSVAAEPSRPADAQIGGSLISPAALAAEGDPSEVTTLDIRAALGLPAAGAAADTEDDAAPLPTAADTAGDTDSDDAALTDEEQAAAEAELATAASPEPFDEDTAAPAEAPAADPALTAKIAALETETAGLREKLAAREAADANTLTPSPAAVEAITDPEALNNYRARMVNLYAWAVQHADGGEIADAKGGTVSLSREEVAAIQAEAFTQVHQHIPARERYLSESSQRERDALNTYPWLKETSRGLGAEAAALLQKAPALRRLPEHKLLAADAALGARLRTSGVTFDEATLTRMLAAAKGEATRAAAGQGNTVNGRPVAPRTPPSSPSRPGVVPPRTRTNAAAVQAAQKAVARSGGSVQSLAASIAAKLGR
jgi:hypothetical protein